MSNVVVSLFWQRLFILYFIVGFFMILCAYRLPSCIAWNRKSTLGTAKKTTEEESEQRPQMIRFDIRR